MHKSSCDAKTVGGSYVQCISICEKGPVRENNEDSIAIARGDEHGVPEKGTLLIVADGMGGMTQGERASGYVTSELPSVYFSSSNKNPVEALVSAAHEMNSRLYRMGHSTSAGHQMMGTTLVAVVVLHECVITVNVGDSRAYLLQGERLVQLSSDHTVRRRFYHPFRKQSDTLAHILTQAIGPQPTITPYVSVHRTAPHDVVMLCSDGLSAILSDAEIEQTLRTEPFEDAPLRLKEEVYRRGGDDNLSVILSRTVNRGAPLQPQSVTE